MNLAVQPAFEAFAIHSQAARVLAVASAEYLVYALARLWICAVALHAQALSFGALARVALVLVLSLLLGVVLTRVVADPRPFLVDHTQPLAPVSSDKRLPLGPRPARLRLGRQLVVD